MCININKKRSNIHNRFNVKIKLYCCWWLYKLYKSSIFCLFITEILEFSPHITHNIISSIYYRNIGVFRPYHTKYYLKSTYASCGRPLIFTPGNEIKRNSTAYSIHCLDHCSYGPVKSQGNINQNTVHSKQWDFFSRAHDKFWKISTFTIPSLSTRHKNLIFFMSKQWNSPFHLLFLFSKGNHIFFFQILKFRFFFYHSSTFNKGNSPIFSYQHSNLFFSTFSLQWMKTILHTDTQILTSCYCSIKMNKKGEDESGNVKLTMLNSAFFL